MKKLLLFTIIAWFGVVSCSRKEESPEPVATPNTQNNSGGGGTGGGGGGGGGTPTTQPALTINQTRSFGAR